MTKDKLPEIAADIVMRARNQDHASATVIALKGELGAGKTTLSQEIAKALGVKENIISPTFVIMKRYEITDEKFKQLIHIDAYRLDSSAELLKLGFQELLADKHNLILIEWPEQVPECIPEHAIKIELKHKEEDTRTLTIED